MKTERVTWAVIAFLLGNVTGIFGTVAAFGADIRELKVKFDAIDRRVTTVEQTQSARLIQQAGTPRGNQP